MKKILGVGILSAVGLFAADIEVFSHKELQASAEKLEKNGQGFAAETLARWGNHYTMLAVREQTGSAEVHEHEADFFVVESGDATLVSGGKVVNPRTEKAGEIRGSSIEGGTKHSISVGDVIHIPAGVPHQLLIPQGGKFSYFVVKVTGQ